MLIIKAVTITQDGEKYTAPEIPIPQRAICVVHDGTNYIVYEPGDTLPQSTEQPAEPEA